MSYPYIQARNHGGTQTVVNRIVIHGTVSPCVRGGARNVANDFHTTTHEASAHYVVDPGEIVQCLTERTIGWHAPPNTGSIGIELCDPQTGSSARWADAGHEAMLRLAARLVREVAARWKVPLVKLSAAQLKAGHRGICGHADVSAAFHQTDHTDPGTGFPWAHFMDLVTGSGEDDDVSAAEVWDHQIAVPDYGKEEHPTDETISAGGWLRGAEIKISDVRDTVSALDAKVAGLDSKLDAILAKLADTS